MNLFDFARSCGILLDSMPPIGYWKRYPTADHPKKRNGAIKFMGEYALIQNWATDSEVSIWKDENSTFDPAKARKAAADAARKIREGQEAAAKKAGWILHQTIQAKHPYLQAKGFDEYSNVWSTEDGNILVIPMRIGNRLMGCQLIKEDGTKKFLYGQRTSNAEFVFDNKGEHILCEGYATALSIRAALMAMKRRYTLHVCFSAGNMEKIAATLPGGFVVADNDASQTGENTAKRIGWSYYLPPNQGEDFNDFHKRVGLFKASQALVTALNASKRSAQ